MIHRNFICRSQIYWKPSCMLANRTRTIYDMFYVYSYNKLSVYENYINYYILHLRWDVYIIITIWCNVYMSLYILTKCYMEYNNGCNLPYVINYMIHLQFHHLTDCFENSPFTLVKKWALRIIKLRMKISCVLWWDTRITDTLVMLEKCIW